MSTETPKPSRAHWRTTLRRLGACDEGVAYAMTQPDIETAWNACGDATFLAWLALRLSSTNELIDAHNTAIAHLNNHSSLRGKRAAAAYRKRVPWSLVAPAFRAAQREHSKRKRGPSTEPPTVAQPSAPAVRELGFIADSDLPDDVACDECGHCGTQEPDDCDVCDGDGYLKCFDCGGAHNVKCETCKGSRTVRCDDCHGTGDGEICDISCGDCEDMRYQVAADAEFLWRRDLGRNVTNGTAALYVKFAVSDYRAALVAQAESEAA